MEIYHTESQENYTTLMRELENSGHVWHQTSIKPTAFNAWGICETDTHIFVDSGEVFYGSTPTYAQEPIITYRGERLYDKERV